MRAIGLGILLCLAACGSSARHDPPPPRASASASQPPPIDGVVIRPAANGLHVGYRALPPAQRFAFADRGAAEIRKDTWKALGDGVSLADDGVTASSSISAFEIAIAPDSKERDRVYPALTPVGEGWLIYAPHLRLEGAPAGLAVETPPGWNVTGRRGAGGALVGDGYVFTGPSAYLHQGAADVIRAPSIPAWLAGEVDAAASGAVAFYGRRLGLPLARRPAIVISHDQAGNGSFRGDTTPGAMMSLRFRGASWNERDPAAVERVADFVHHEIFHFWNGELARSSQGDTRPWLHEGGANYAALLASRDRGTMSQERMLVALDRHLERCQVALANRDLRDNGPKNGGDTYACGTVLQWALDIGLRKSSNGARDVLSWWKDVFAQARTEGGTYSFERAYALVGAEASRAASVLLDAGDDGRWAAFAEAAGKYGVPMEQRRQASRDLATALDHLLVLQCGPQRGFFTFPDHVKLDTGTRCGPLAGDLEIDAVAGRNPVTEASAMHDEVRRRCAARTGIDLGYKGKIVARIACSTPLAEAKPAWQIRRE